MAKEKPTTKTCKHCKTEIPYDAKVCPQCRKKQGGGGCLTKILIVIAVIIILGAVSSLMGDDSDTTTESNEATTAEEKIEYEKVSVADMMSVLNKNAAKASKTYKDKYLEITGTVDVIDSDLSYVSITSGDDFEIVGVQCYIKNEEQENQVVEMEVGDKVTIQGLCTDVGEVLGYSVDIINI